MRIIVIMTMIFLSIIAITVNDDYIILEKEQKKIKIIKTVLLRFNKKQH